MVHDSEIQGLATITELQDKMSTLTKRLDSLSQAFDLIADVCKNLHKIGKLNREAIELLMKAIESLAKEVKK